MRQLCVISARLRLRLDMHARRRDQRSDHVVVVVVLDAQESLCLVERQRLGRGACQKNRDSCASFVSLTIRGEAMSRVPSVMIVLIVRCSRRRPWPSPAMRRRPPAWAARPIVMIVDARERSLHRHGAGARPGAHRRALRHAGRSITRSSPIRPARHRRCAPSCATRASIIASYAASRATADIALLKLAAPLPDIMVPATLAAPRRVAAGETLTIAGFGVTLAGTARGLGAAAHGDADGDRQARLAADPALRTGDAQPAHSASAAAPAIPARRRSTATARWLSAW